MSHAKLIAVPCHISEGIVSDERAFELTLVNGEVHTGAAPRFYFWNNQDPTARAARASRHRRDRREGCGKALGAEERACSRFDS